MDNGTNDNFVLELWNYNAPTLSGACKVGIALDTSTHANWQNTANIP